MKAFVCLAVARLCLGSAFAVETCKSITQIPETACNYSSAMTLLSASKNLQMDSNNCNMATPKSEWQPEPTITFSEAKPDKTYSVLCIAPDPPGYEKGQFYLHWLVSNVRGEDLAKGDLSKGNHQTGWFGPAPALGSGLHRYFFVALEEQTPGQNVENPPKRTRFEFLPWLQRHPDLCGPVAGMQFRTQY